MMWYGPSWSSEFCAKAQLRRKGKGRIVRLRKLNKLLSKKDLQFQILIIFLWEKHQQVLCFCYTATFCIVFFILTFLHFFPQRLSLTNTRNEFDFSNAEGNWIFLYWMHPFNDSLCSGQFSEWPDINLMIWLKELKAGDEKD